MGWNCKICGTHNEESDRSCIACSTSRAEAEIKEESPHVTIPEPAVRPATSSGTRTITPVIRTTSSESRKPDSPKPPDRRRRPRRTIDKRKVVTIITFCLMAISFAVGQTLLYVFYNRQGVVFALTPLVNAASSNFNYTAFFGVTTSIGAIAGILLCYKLYRLIKLKQYVYVWLVTLPYCIAIIMIPSLIACIAVVFGIIFIFIRKRKATKVTVILYVIIMLASIIVFPSVAAGVSKSESNPVSIESGQVTYIRGEDGKYYVSAWAEEKDLLIIPTILNGKYNVGGMTKEFQEEHDGYVFQLNFEHATENNQILQVVVFNLKTDEKFPIPQRTGYTFYGWWSTNNRNTGKQIVDKNGKLVVSNVAKEQEIFAMWYGTDYIFISSYNDFYINNYEKYVLTNDIEMPGEYTPIGGLSGMELQSSRHAFNGVLDGNFHTIKYSISGSRRYSGLFSWVGSNGIVKNLGVNANIKVEFKPTNSIYYAFAGGIAAINDGTISNCWCSGQIYLKNSTSVGFSGGIAGGSGTENSHTGEIKTCYNIANIETVADDAYAGGILGTAENNSHIVSYCYNRGTVKATGANSNNTAVGGIISHGRTYAKNCFNAGAILTDYSDKQTLGGIIGFTRNTSSHGNFPTDCVWLKANNCQAQWGVGTYPNDKSGGNNTGVTAVSKENEKALEILNGNTNNFKLLNGKIQLTWESL